MSSVVVDTHAVVWYLLNDQRLSRQRVHPGSNDKRGRSYIDSIHQSGRAYLPREKRRIPASTYTRLRSAIGDPDGPYQLAPLDQDVADAIQSIDRQVVPDLPDRVIAATAFARDLPLVSRGIQKSAPRAFKQFGSPEKPKRLFRTCTSDGET